MEISVTTCFTILKARTSGFFLFFQRDNEINCFRMECEPDIIPEGDAGPSG